MGINYYFSVYFGPFGSMYYRKAKEKKAAISRALKTLLVLAWNILNRNLISFWPVFLRFTQKTSRFRQTSSWFWNTFFRFGPKCDNFWVTSLIFGPILLIFWPNILRFQWNIFNLDQNFQDLDLTLKYLDKKTRFGQTSLWFWPKFWTFGQKS